MPQWAPTSGKTLLINIVPSGKIHSKSVSTVKMRIPTKINSNANTPSYKIGSPVKIHLNVEWNDCSQVSKHFGFPVDILVSPFVPPFIWTFWFPRLYHHSSSYFSISRVSTRQPHTKFTYQQWKIINHLEDENLKKDSTLNYLLLWFPLKFS